MKFRFFCFKNIGRLIVIGVLCGFAFTSIAVAQKKPKSLKLDADSDDRQICSPSPMKDSEFCGYYAAYTKSDATTEQKRQARNQMADLVRGQVDSYYKMRKDGRRTNIKWLQAVFDILEVSAATAISFINGERVKTVIGSALNGFQGGRTSLNKNLEILQTQVLINKMNTNRALVMTEIVTNRGLSTNDYSWYAAKNDLRRYLLAGTFNDALDTLVNQTGAEVEQDEKELREVGPQKLTTSATLTDEDLANRAGLEKADLRKKLKGTDAEKAAALKRIKAIVVKLEADDSIQKLLDGETISSSTDDGEKILNALREIIIKQTREGRVGRDIIAKINRTFIETE